MCLLTLLFSFFTFIFDMFWFPLLLVVLTAAYLLTAYFFVVTVAYLRTTYFFVLYFYFWFVVDSRYQLCSYDIFLWPSISLLSCNCRFLNYSDYIFLCSLFSLIIFSDISSIPLAFIARICHVTLHYIGCSFSPTHLPLSGLFSLSYAIWWSSFFILSLNFCHLWTFFPHFEFTLI